MERITIHTIRIRKIAAPRYKVSTRPVVARSTLNWDESYEESLITNQVSERIHRELPYED